MNKIIKWQNLQIFIAITVLIILIFFAGRLLKKQSTHISQYQHIQFPGHGYSINCAYLPAKESFPVNRSVLIVYLHGLFASCEQAFEIPNKYPFAFAATDAFPNAAFLSCDYGSPGSWCSNADYNDITSSIEEISKSFPFSRIVITGTSMGGCTALSYAATAPEDIRNKIIGVLAIYAAGDLTHLYEETKSVEVRQSLETAFHGTPKISQDQYLKTSCIANLPTFPHQTKVYLISALKDKIIPAKLQNELFEQLKATTIPVRIETLPCYHVSIPPSESFVRGLKFVLSSGN